MLKTTLKNKRKTLNNKLIYYFMALQHIAKSFYLYVFVNLSENIT